MARRNILVCFTGIDGSGKTTLSRKVVELLEARGVRSQYVYARLQPRILRPFTMLGDWLFLRGRDASGNYQEYSSHKRHAINRHPLLSDIYQRILLLDYALQAFFKVRIPFALGKNLVCDRYVYDTVVTDLCVDMGYSQKKLGATLDSLFRFLPAPDITFLVDVPEEIAYQRKDDVLSIDFLKERRRLYLELSNQYPAVVLDGSKDLAELGQQVQEEIITELSKH